MTTPLIHIFSADIREGQLESYEGYAEEHASFVEENNSELLSFNAYLSEEGKRVSTVQVHPDPDSMDTFMKEIVPGHGVQAYQYLERGSERSDAFGMPSDTAQTQIREFGVELHLSPIHLGGFSRFTGWDGVDVTVPLVHVYSVDVEEDQLAAFQRYVGDHVEFVDANHPDLLAFHVFLTDSGPRVSFVQVHSDTHSMDLFMEKIVPTYGKEAMQYYRQGTMRSDIYGSLSETATKHMRQFGVDLRLNPRHLGGFTRVGN